MGQFFTIPFEILAQPVLPAVPGVAPGPLIQQGFFVQLFNDVNFDANITFAYTAQPGFVASQAFGDLEIMFSANVLDSQGNITFLTDQVVKTSGFSYTIPQFTVALFGIQYFVTPNSGLGAAPLPQSGYGSRGQLSIANQSQSGGLNCLATIRQVVASYAGAGAPTILGASAYAVPAIEVNN